MQFGIRNPNNADETLVIDYCNKTALMSEIRNKAELAIMQNKQITRAFFDLEIQIREERLMAQFFPDCEKTIKKLSNLQAQLAKGAVQNIEIDKYIIPLKWLLDPLNFEFKMPFVLDDDEQPYTLMSEHRNVLQYPRHAVHHH